MATLLTSKPSLLPDAPVTCYAAQGWTPIAHEEELRRDELVGHLDIRAWHTDFGEAIIDLKTGQGIGAAWLQVGGYLSLSEPSSHGVASYTFHE